MSARDSPTVSTKLVRALPPAFQSRRSTIGMFCCGIASSLQCDPVEDDATLPDAGAARASVVAPQTIDKRYQLGTVIGRGGMGEVRLARDIRIDRDVAVKLMRHATT